MIAKDGVALGAFEFLQHACTFPRGCDGRRAGQELVGGEVAGEEDRIGTQAVDVVDSLAQEETFSELIEVNVAELDDAKAVERCGEIGDADFRMGYLDVMTGNFT